MFLVQRCVLQIGCYVLRKEPIFCIFVANTKLFWDICSPPITPKLILETIYVLNSVSSWPLSL